MNLAEMITTAADLLDGGQKELASRIGVAPSQITDAKAGRSKLPATACGKLAEVLKIDRWTVIAASELVTEKDADKRAYMARFAEGPRKAAAWLLAIATAAMTALFAPTDAAAAASDATNVSLTTREPAPHQGLAGLCNVYYVQCRAAINRIAAAALDTLGACLTRFYCPG